MPVSPADRLISGGISRLMERISSNRRLIPDEGLTRSAFVDSCLADVDALAIDDVLKAAHRRKAVFVSRRGGAIRVFRERPPKGAIENGLSHTPLGHFLAAIAPHFHGLKTAELRRMSANERDEWAAHGEADDTIRAHVYRILTVCRSHADRGLSVETIRSALHETFAPDALAALAFYEPRLQSSSKADNLRIEAKIRQKRAQKNLPFERRIVNAIERAGHKGVTKTDLVRMFPPPRPSSKVAYFLDKLDAEGFVVSKLVRLQASGRPATRYFYAPIGAPRTDEKGIIRPFQ